MINSTNWLERFKLLLFVFFSLLYIASEPWRPYPLHYLLKAVPILILMAYAHTLLAGPLRVKTLLALLFSAGGDVMLSMAFNNSFVAGLGSFLIAQLVYAHLFFGLRNAIHPSAKVIFTITAGLFAAVMAMLVLPDDAGLRIAVMCYLVVITGMAIAAAWAWRGSTLHIAGAVTFVISDSLIAWNMFRQPIPAASLLVMSTYYAAQMMLVVGIRRIQSSEQPSAQTGAFAPK